MSYFGAGAFRPVQLTTIVQREQLEAAYERNRIRDGYIADKNGRPLPPPQPKRGPAAAAGQAKLLDDATAAHEQQRQSGAFQFLPPREGAERPPSEAEYEQMSPVTRYAYLKGHPDFAEALDRYRRSQLIPPAR
jgi:hypothetical protein